MSLCHLVKVQQEVDEHDGVLDEEEADAHVTRCCDVVKELARDYGLLRTDKGDPHVKEREWDDEMAKESQILYEDHPVL